MTSSRKQYPPGKQRHPPDDTPQEEPQNMGPWPFVQPRIEKIIPQGVELQFIGRKTAASPATGISVRHKVEQASILEAILKDNRAKETLF